MQFHKTINLYAFPRELVKHLQPGQWVAAGDNGPLGRFYGVKRSGVVVVAWKDNAKRSGDYFDYCKTLHAFSKG